jgi:uncharacterized membrane-anchored protein
MDPVDDTAAAADVSKVPAVKPAADAVTMSMNLGYLSGVAIFAVLVTAQMAAKRFHPFLYSAVVIATTTVGTTFADFVDGSLGSGHLGGSSLPAGLLVASLAAWRPALFSTMFR